MNWSMKTWNNCLCERVPGFVTLRRVWREQGRKRSILMRKVHPQDRPGRSLVMRTTGRATAGRQLHLSGWSWRQSQDQLTQQQQWTQMHQAAFLKARHYSPQSLSWGARHSTGRGRQTSVVNVPIVLLQKEIHIMKLYWQEQFNQG